MPTFRYVALCCTQFMLTLRSFLLRAQLELDFRSDALIVYSIFALLRFVENDNSATERKISAHFARIVRSYLVRKPSRNEAQNECKLRTNRALKL